MGKKTGKPSHRSVYVLWIDSFGGGGWTGTKHAKAPRKDMLCHSVGWIIKENDDVIVLSSSTGGRGNSCLNPVTIPRVAIEEMRPVAIGKPRAK